MLAGAAWSPPGVIGRVEPFPGWAPNATLLAGATVATLVVVTTLAASTAARAGRVRAGGGAVRPRPRRLPRAAWLLAGLRVGATRARSARVGAAVGVAGIVAVVVFGASLHRLADTPSRWGWNGQFEVMDTRPPVIAQLTADRRVRGLAEFHANTLVVDDQEVEAYAERDVKGRAGWSVLDGRPPAAHGEVLLGSALARRWHLQRGDSVAVALPSGFERFRVVGTGVGPLLNSESLGDAVVVTQPDLEAAGRGSPSSYAIVDAPTGAEAIYQQLVTNWELTHRTPPTEVTDLTALGRLPDLLGLVLLAVALAAFAHGLLMSGASRDLAVLRTVGLTRRQATAAGITVAVIAACIGLAVGIPTGAAIGRFVWWAVAQSHGVATDASIPVVGLVALVPPAIAVGAAIGWVAARRTLRGTPATVLRAE